MIRKFTLRKKAECYFFNNLSKEYSAKKVIFCQSKNSIGYTPDKTAFGLCDDTDTLADGLKYHVDKDRLNACSSDVNWRSKENKIRDHKIGNYFGRGSKCFESYIRKSEIKGWYKGLIQSM